VFFLFTRRHGRRRSLPSPPKFLFSLARRQIFLGERRFSPASYQQTLSPLSLTCFSRVWSSPSRADSSTIFCVADSVASFPVSSVTKWLEADSDFFPPDRTITDTLHGQAFTSDFTSFPNQSSLFYFLPPQQLSRQPFRNARTVGILEPSSFPFHRVGPPLSTIPATREPFFCS